MRAASRPKMDLLVEVNQRIQLRVYLQYYVTTVAAIAARWPAPRHIFLAPEGDGTIPTVTRLHVDFCLIKEHCTCSSEICGLVPRVHK